MHASLSLSGEVYAILKVCQHVNDAQCLCPALKSLSVNVACIQQHTEM